MNLKNIPTRNRFSKNRRPHSPDLCASCFNFLTVLMNPPGADLTDTNQLYIRKPGKFQYTILGLLLLISSGLMVGQSRAYRDFFTQGNFLLLEKNYPMALKSFLDAYAIDSTNANINYKVGLCYLNSASEKQKAIPFLAKAVLNASKKYVDFEPTEKKAPLIAYYNLGEAYRISASFTEANANFSKYKDIAKPKEADMKEIEHQINSSIVAAEMVKTPVNVTIENVGDSINSEYPDYNAVVSADESKMIFTSRRLGSTGGEKTIDDQYYEDIYESYRKKDGTWSTARNIGPPINTNGNEASVSLSVDGQELFVSKESNGGDIYYTNLEGDKWTPLAPLGSDINTKYAETHATLSSDGNTIYFVSDRPGGYGGRDIYRCVKLPNGQWSLALNLGPTINTPYDEDTPFIHPDGVTLYFSSNGHQTMGGADIFKTTRNTENNAWSEPANLGYPINTADDDLFYVPTTDGIHAYYASSKPGGKGNKDIYRITLESAVSEPITLVKGYLTFDGTKNIPKNVLIKAFDAQTLEKVQEATPNLKTGKYVLTLNPGPAGKIYNVTYESEGFQPISETLKVEPGSTYQEVEREVGLKSINFESKTPGTIAYSGNITNKDGTPLPGAVINIKDNNTGKLVDTYYSNATDGTYYFVLHRGENYNITFEAGGYLFQSENINVPKGDIYSQVTNVIVLDSNHRTRKDSAAAAESMKKLAATKSEISKNIVLEPIKDKAITTLKNIFFATGKSDLSSQSKAELDNIYKLLKENSNINIEISGHTDNTGTDKINIKLSQDRAGAVVTVLTKKGIAANRLIPKGYGSSNPIASNTLPDGKPDKEGMRQNRRVELKVIEVK